MDWIGVDGNGVGYGGSSNGFEGNNGSRLINTYGRPFVTTQAPATATGMRVYLMKQGTHAGENSYAWFLRPQVVKVDPKTTVAVPYTAGNGSAEQVSNDARIKNVETVINGDKFASATRASTLEAQMRRETPSILNNAINDVNGRIDTVNSSNITYTNARIEERAQAWASQEAGAVANRAGTLEAQMRRETPSALNNAISDVNGRIDTVNNTTVINLNSRIEERAQAWASQEAGAVAVRANTLEAQMRREVPSVLNNAVNDVNGRIDSVNSATVSTLNTRIEDRATAIADAKAGAVAQTVSNLESRYNQTVSTVSTQAGTIATLEGRSSSYWQVLAVANGNRAQITVRSDSNGGAGVDIVGDVNFAGNLNVGPDSGGNRMKLTNSGATVYDANGTLRVRWGLW